MTPLLVLLACTPAGSLPADGTGPARDGGAQETGSTGTDGGLADGGATDGGAADGGAADGGAADGGAADGGAADGGGADTGDAGGDTGADGGAEPELDLRLRGPYEVATSTGSATTTSGCDIRWTRYSPAGGSTAPQVILAHGLQRTGEQMSTWGDHLASWGLDVVAPDLCNSNAWDLDQEQNGHDLAELAHWFTSGEVIYVGHSAGGLASFVAAALDPQAVGLLGLDPTEFLDIGAAVAGGLAVPAGGLLGDPGICNLSNNALDLYAAVPDSQVLRVTDADHCDFENPTDWVCTLACGTSSNERYSEEELAETIAGLVTAWLLWQGGLDPAGQEWWTAGGGPYEELLADGAISVP